MGKAKRKTDSVALALSGKHPDLARSFLANYLYTIDAGGPIDEDTQSFVCKAFQDILNKHKNADAAFGLVGGSKGRKPKSAFDKLKDLEIGFRVGLLVKDGHTADDAIKRVAEETFPGNGINKEPYVKKAYFTKKRK